MCITFSELGKNGRLGNQMFQIASTIGIAIKNNDVAIFPNWNYSQYFKNPINQSSIQINNFISYQEHAFNYNEVYYNGNLNLNGYFQSELYFKHCEDLIRFHFQPNDSIINNLIEKYGDLFNEKTTTCSIHIRRGDYINNPVHEVCNIEYYQKSIEYIKSKTKIDKFIIFSDDINWCKNIFSGNYIFIEGNLDIEDLFLMSMCNHNIIANSSFSWWGSWLNSNKNKIIIAPEKWFKTNDINSKDVYTSNMIKYNCLNFSEIIQNNKKNNVGLLIIATGKYDHFVNPLLNSARNFFCKNKNVTFFIFTDSQQNFGPDTVKIFKEHENWPMPTLMRYNTFIKNQEFLKDQEFLYYCDADMLFVDHVGDEILSDLVGTIHPGYNGKRGTPEENRRSLAYISPETPLTYFAGGFNGGKREFFLNMAKTIDNNIQHDYKQGIIAIWHDESHLNKYFTIHKPTKILDPGYCYGEHMNLQYKKKLLALTKDHNFFRGYI